MLIRPLKSTVSGGNEHAGKAAWRSDPATLKRVLLVVIGALTIWIAAVEIAPGHRSIDELNYHLMLRSLWEFGSLSLLNGYQDFASDAFLWSTTLVHNGQLVSQYPELYAVLAAPFYLVMGYQGLFVMNAAAFCIALWLCYLIAKRAFDDSNLAFNACLILAFATYIWGYALAAWPHSLSCAMVVAAVYFALRAHDAPARRHAVAWALAAGLVTGLGVGVRIDAVFVLPTLLFVMLFANPVRLIPAGAVILGMVPPLAAMAAINHAKFGVASPFSYGASAAKWSSGTPLGYLPLVALAVGVAAVLWPLTRPGGRAFVKAHRWPVAATSLVMLGGLLAVPGVWTFVAQLANGFYQLIIDLRIRDMSIAEGGLQRGPGGSMIYIGGLKKTLLQSCPYIAAIGIPIWALLRGRGHTFMLAVLLLVPVTFIGVYSRFAWHGGSCLNLRYFVPVLPFAAILIAYAWRDLGKTLGGGTTGIKIGLVIAALVAVGWFWARFVTELSLPQDETVMLSVPLVFAAAVFASSLAYLAISGPTRRLAARATQASLVVGFAWAALVTFTYDAPRAILKRNTDAQVARQVRPLIAPGAIIMTDRRPRFASLYDSGDYRVAAVNLDDFVSLRPVLQWSFRVGRPVYAWFTPPAWQSLKERGYFKSYCIKPLAQVMESSFAQILPETPGNAAQGCQPPNPR